jgi:hypothetical protein
MDPAVLILAASNIGAVVVASWLEHRGTSRVAQTLAESQKATAGKSAELARELQHNSAMTEHTMTVVNNQRTLMEAKIERLEKMLELRK